MFFSNMQCIFTSFPGHTPDLMDPHQAVPNMACSVKKDLLDCQEISCPALAVYTDPVNLHFSLSDFRILGRTFKTKLKYTSGVTCSQ
jgi:hypothetical protein